MPLNDSLNDIKRAVLAGRTIRNTFGGNVGGGEDIFQIALDAIAAMGDASTRKDEERIASAASATSPALSSCEIPVINYLERKLDDLLFNWRMSEDESRKDVRRHIIDLFHPYLTAREPVVSDDVHLNAALGILRVISGWHNDYIENHPKFVARSCRDSAKDFLKTIDAAWLKYA